MRMSDWSSDVCSSDLFVAIEFREPVDDRRLEFGRGMIEPIPFAIVLRVTQPEVGAEIDHFQVRGQLADEILAEPMGEGAKDDIDACEIDLIDFRQRRYIEMPQMRERSEEHTSELQSLMR